MAQAAALTGSDAPAQAARPIVEPGGRLTEAALLFEDVLDGGELGDKIDEAAAGRACRGQRSGG